MNKNIIKTTIISLFLFSSMLFIHIDDVKACKCYYETDWFEYAASANPDGSNSSSQMKALAIIEFTANSADVVNSCVGMRTYSQGSNAYKPGKNMLYVESFDKCTLKDFDRGNPFDVNSKEISDANCSVVSCKKAKLYYYPGGKGEIQTKSGVFNHAFTAETAEQHEATINEDNQTALENGDVEDIDPNIVVPSDPTIKKQESVKSTCDLIGPSVMQFLKNLFFIIQVIGVILLVVMSMIGFIKALTGSDDDSLKKEFKNIFKRIIITIILLLLPMLIIWVLNIVNSNAYVTDNNGKRVVGTNNQPLCKW